VLSYFFGCKQERGRGGLSLSHPAILVAIGRRSPKPSSSTSETPTSSFPPCGKTINPQCPTGACALVSPFFLPPPLRPHFAPPVHHSDSQSPLSVWHNRSSLTWMTTSQTFYPCYCARRHTSNTITPKLVT